MDEAASRRELVRIRALMEDGQRLVRGTWRHQVLWGLLAAGGLVLTWGAVHRELWTVAWLAWPVLIVAGWTASLVLARRGARTAPVNNLATRAFGGVWIASGVTLTLLGTLGLYSGALTPTALPGVLALVFGLAYFASGFASGLGWLRGVGVAWWVVGSGLLVWRSPTGLLVLAAATLALEVGPALALRRREAEAPTAR